MGFNGNIKLYLKIAIVILIHFATIKSSISNKLLVEGDFNKAVLDYCKNRDDKNFCSEKHIKIMFDLEKKRQEILEMERQMKRMEYEIMKKLYEMNSKAKKYLSLT